MTDIRQRLADALVQAAREGDNTPRLWVSERVLEIMAEGAPRVVAVQASVDLKGQALKAALDQPGRSQSAMARALGWDKFKVNRICQGRQDITAEEAEQISAYLAATEDASPGVRLRAARKLAGMSANQVAGRTGLAESTIYGHENGSRGMNDTDANAYANVMGVAPEWILFGRGRGPAPLGVAP